MNTYDVVVVHRTGKEHVHRYTTEDPLEPGDIVRLEGRHWLIERIDGERAQAKPARYRLRLRYPDGREDVGAFRRLRPGSPRACLTKSTRPRLTVSLSSRARCSALNSAGRTGPTCSPRALQILSASRPRSSDSIEMRVYGRASAKRR